MRVGFTVLSLALVSLSCGRTEQKIELKNKLLEETNDPNCKKGACPEIDYSLVDGSGVALANKTLEGVMGSNVEWLVKVKSTAPAGRIKIAFGERPGWFEKRDGASPGSMVIFGIPTSTVEQNTFTIIARDISRCAALEKQTKLCTSKDGKFPQYEKTFTLKYTIR